MQRQTVTDICNEGVERNASLSDFGGSETNRANNGPANSDGLIFGLGSAGKFLYEQPIDNALVDASIEFAKIMDLNG